MDMLSVPLMKNGLFIPMAEIGSSHRDWGMEIYNNAPRVSDRAGQHACYVQAGSFGDFLINTFGVEKMNHFNQLSRDEPRPWKQVFGESLEQLEARRLAHVRSKAQERKAEMTGITIQGRPVMATYFVIEILKVRDKAMYKRYVDAARLIVESRGGEYIIRSNDVTLVSGAEKPERVVVIQFPDEKALKSCFDSQEYCEIAPLRVQSTESRAFIVNQ